jgi:hypothetical protein
MSSSGIAADLGYGSVLSGRCRRGVVESGAGNSSVALADCDSIRPGSGYKLACSRQIDND